MIKKENIIILMAFLLWVVGDVVTTGIGFSNGLKERNPILAPLGFFGIVVVKLVFFVIAITIAKWVRNTKIPSIRYCIYYTMVVIGILTIVINGIGIASAETGNITIEDEQTVSYSTDAVLGTGVVYDYTTIYYDVANYNQLDDFNIVTNSANAFHFSHEFESTAFTITSGGSGSGVAWYDKNATKMYWVFFTGATFISSPLTLSYATNIFANVTRDSYDSSTLDVGVTKPIEIKAGTGHIRNLNYVSKVSAITTDTYNVTYPAPGLFTVSINKGGSVADKYFIKNTNSVEYTHESSFNTVDFDFTGNYNAGIVLNGTLATGAYTQVTVNSTGASVPSTTVTITTDKTDYQRGDTITITVSNPSVDDVWLTAYGQTGIMTDILWNTKVNAGSNFSVNKLIKDDYPLGAYSISAATTESYAPVVAITYFNISLPSNTSNELGLLWDSATYSMGSTGVVHSQSNFNTTTMLITSPAGHTSTFSFPANATNSTGITLDESGSWQARLTDDGNASNFITSITYVFPLPPTDNETQTLCQQQSTYVCFNKREYRQGESFSLNFKLTPKTTDIFNNNWTTYITIENPYYSVVVNRSVNGTYETTTGNFVGSFSGAFSTTAITGDYTARIYVSNWPFQPEIRAEGYAILLSRNATVTTTPQTGNWTTTQTGVTTPCQFWDGWVGFMGMGINDISRFQFALLIIGLITIISVAATKNLGIGVSMGFFPYAFFLYLSLSTSCGTYIPTWTAVFIALIIGIKMRWFA